MASYSVALAKHATLAANVVDAVTFTTNPGEVEVLNRGTVLISATSNDATPAVLGDDTLAIPAGQALRFSLPSTTDTVKLKAAAICDYSVTAVG